MVETGEGLVVVTGCAHPGVVEMVRRAKESVPGEVVLVMGGLRRATARATGRGGCSQMYNGADCALAGVEYVVTIGSGGTE